MSHSFTPLPRDPSQAHSHHDFRPLYLPIPQLLLSFIGSVSHDDTERTSTRVSKRCRPYSTSTDSVIRLRINAEAIRFIAYVFFIIMISFAITMTKTITSEALLNPPDSKKGCPPFERFGGDGFHISNESHLIEAFGFNNICVNWDYSPSRELTAIVYPLFEYGLLAYLVLDFLLVAISYKKGLVSGMCWNLARLMFPFNIFLCAMFRMIFVVTAYLNVRGHTAGFLGLQIVLINVTALNVMYVISTGVQYKLFGKVQFSNFMLYLYFALNMIIGAVKLYLTAYVVFALGGENVYYPEFALEQITAHLTVGQLVDHIWMVFNLVLPFFISLYRALTEPDLFITIDLEDMTAAVTRET